MKLFHILCLRKASSEACGGSLLRVFSLFYLWENQGSATLISCISLSSCKGSSARSSESGHSALPSKEQEMSWLPVGQLALSLVLEMRSGQMFFFSMSTSSEPLSEARARSCGQRGGGLEAWLWEAQSYLKRQRHEPTEARLWNGIVKGFCTASGSESEPGPKQRWWLNETHRCGAWGHGEAGPPAVSAPWSQSSSERGFQMTSPAAPGRKLSGLQYGGCWVWARHLKESKWWHSSWGQGCWHCGISSGEEAGSGQDGTATWPYLPKEDFGKFHQWLPVSKETSPRLWHYRSLQSGPNLLFLFFR